MVRGLSGETGSSTCARAWKNPDNKAREKCYNLGFLLTGCISWSLADDETRKREVTPLLKASQGMNIKKKLIITWNEEYTLEEGIQVVPIWKYLIGRC